MSEPNGSTQSENDKIETDKADDCESSESEYSDSESEFDHSLTDNPLLEPGGAISIKRKIDSDFFELDMKKLKSNPNDSVLHDEHEFSSVGEEATKPEIIEALDAKDLDFLAHVTQELPIVEPENDDFSKQSVPPPLIPSSKYEDEAGPSAGCSPKHEHEALLEESPILKPLRSDAHSEAMDIHEKLKEMGEISVKPVSKSDTAVTKKKEDDNEVSVEIKKKSGETEDGKRITNLRKNIREVMDENQLDATTLAAQRQESERLARVQEQQKIIRELQRQMAVERQNNRTQNRVMSILQGQASLLKNSSSTDRVNLPGGSTDMYIVKGVASEVQFKGTGFVDIDKISSGNLTPSVSIAPVRRPKSVEQEPIPEGIEEEKKEVVTIVDSSSEDDCIVLSDDDEDMEEEPEDDPHNSGLHVNDAYNIPDEQGRVVINIGHPEGENDIFVAPQIARIIKPHQIGGVRFLFDNIIESVERFSTSTGFGCILAHSMGLGKTLQIVCFCDIFLRHTNSKSVLCIMPINTLQNWVSEFNMWLPDDPEKSPLRTQGEVRPRNFKIFVLNDHFKTLHARAKVILEWAREGGVLLIGYELYRLLSLKLANKKKKSKKTTVEKEVKVETEAHKRLMEDIHAALVRPGPDLVICDEGHRIKNSHASISVALKQIRSKRRIVLTGYPLQNNLLEYWCMVDFVRPNYLGTKTEFANMFERPIQNGQCIDSTPQDIKLMRYRAHVLHSLLVGFVQRRSHVVLQMSLPQKEEYVILVRMTEFQRKLYDVFMNEVVRTKAVPNPLKAFAVCCKIWNHPDVLYNFLKKREADLDLELEEVVEPETPGSTSTTSSASPKGKKKPAAKKPKEVQKDGKTIPSVEVLPNQIKTEPESSFTAQQQQQQQQPAQEIQIKKEEDNNSQVMHTSPASAVQQLPPASTPQQQQQLPEAPPLQPQVQQQAPPPPPPVQYDSMYSQYNSYNYDSYYGQYGNMYQPPPYSNQNYNSPYMQHSQNNFWQGNNYFDYGANQPQVPVDVYNHQTDPYTSVARKTTESFDRINSPTIEDKSSEIVDLDTKEIKTVETNIKLLRLQEIREEPKEPVVEPKVETPEEIVPEKEVVKPKEDGIPYEWAVELMKGYVPDLLESSPKMVIFFRLLEESIKLGDRILVFSQSLLTLNLIEKFLQSNNVPGFEYNWAKNTTYFRLDGSTTAMEREKLINEFNANPQIHLFLVSTRAGSLGINLVGANRVIVFDASWNPCHDTQAVCRVYRYGQKKPCFVYRIVMDHCLEKKIYDRQVNKQGMSDRVVDECNPDAHLSMKEVTNLCYDNDEESDTKDFSDCKDKYLDIVMQKIIQLHCDLLNKEPFHHESLLVDRKEKKLSQAEKRLAQRGYEMEKRAAAKPAYIYSSMGTQYRVMKTPDGAIVHRPVASVRPMQAEVGEKIHGPRPGGVRPTRWIPAEVWQRQGMTAQEMTLPLDVVIPTSSGDKANIVLKAGQKVMVLKSPKGIYMQLESGKIIAIRTSLKVGQNKEKSDDSQSSSRLLNCDDPSIKSNSSSETESSQKSHPTGRFTSESNLRKELNIDALTGGSLHSSTKQNFNFDGNKFGRNSEHNSHGNFKTQPRNIPSKFNIQPNPNPKQLSVQDLLNPKSSSNSHQQHNYNTPNRTRNNTSDDIITIQDREHGSFTQTSKAAPKSQFQRNQFGNTGVRHHSPHMPSATLTANVKPHFNKNPPPLPTITIDDDIETPLREKVVYKPNLVERKQKANVAKSPAFRQGHPYSSLNEGGTGQSKTSSSQNNFNHNSSSSSSSLSSSPSTNNNNNNTNNNASETSTHESSRQYPNVRPYNRQFNDPTPPSHSATSSATNSRSASPISLTKTPVSNKQQKLPNIRNIPAPYPSIYAQQAQSSESKGMAPLNYSIPNPMPNPPPLTPETATTPAQNEYHRPTPNSQGPPEKQSHEIRDRDYPTEKPKSKEGNTTATSVAAEPPQPQVPPPLQPQTQPPPIKSETHQYSSSSSSSSAPSYNHSSNPTYEAGPPPAARSETTDYSSYNALEHGGYQQQPPYANPYDNTGAYSNSYPPPTHPLPPPQPPTYPYGSYHNPYEPHIYGNAQTNPPPPPANYSAPVPHTSPSQPPPGQYQYPGYPPPPGPPASDQYNPYYMYPPYHPPTGQWQQ